MDKRQIKGYEIANRQKSITETKDGWLVKSQSGNGFYKVSDTFICDCPDSELHDAICKHAYAVRYYLDIEKAKPEGTQTERIRLTYKQAWGAYNKAQTSEGKFFDEFLRDLSNSVESEPQITGRPRLLLHDQLFCAIKKVYSQMSSRRASSLFGTARAKGDIEHSPHFNALCQFLRDPATTPILQQLITTSSAPLREVETEFAIDSTGFRTRCFGAYCEGKYPSKREHIWLKLHACCGVKTHIITSAIVGDEYGADSPQFIPLAQKTFDNGFAVEKIFADKGYSSRDNLSYADQLGATAFIPFKDGSNPKSRGSGIWRKMYFYFKMNQDAFMQNYHKRSNIESTFSAMKKKLGETLKTKSHTAQVNELLCKVIAHNIMVLIEEMHELRIAPISMKNGE